MLRAASYLRISSQPQESKYGFQIQAEAVEAYAKKIDAKITRVYKDIISGTIATRHDLEQLKQDSKSYDIVIIPRTDRIARDILVGPQIIAELLESGLQVHLTDIGKFDPNDTQSVFLFNVFSAMAHADHRKIRDNLTKGRINKARAGKLVRPIRAYGYKDNEPYEPQAKWIRYIFEKSLTTGAYTLAKDLTSKGIASPSGASLWYPSTIYVILANPVYKGSWEYGRGLICDICGHTGSYKKSHYNMRHYKAPACRCGASMRLERYTIQVSPIVTPELWQAVQDRFSLGYQVAQRKSPRWDIFPLQGRIKCSECGGVMSGQVSGSHNYYFCRNTLDRTSKKQCSHHVYHRAEVINEAVHETLKKAFLKDELLEKILTLPQPKITNYVAERKEKQAERNRYISFAAKGIITEEELSSHLERIKRELLELVDPPPPQVQPSDINQWRKRVKAALDKDLRELVESANAYVSLGNNRVIRVVVR
jgi:site-specific DNA recombinase